MALRILTLFLTLPVLAWVLVSRLTGKISPQTAANRMGRATVAKPQKQIIWIHAASLGELTAIRSFLEYLTKTKPQFQLLITTNNPAALNVAKNWPNLCAVLQSAPLDLPFVLARFLDHWQPVCFINVETEIWPNRFAALAQRNVCIIGLNARLSDRSMKRLKSLPATHGLQNFTYIFTQNESSKRNFDALLKNKVPVQTLPNLKSSIVLPTTPPDLVAKFDRSNTILAASTHEGEDALILNAFSNLLKTRPDIQLIIAPRHPKRANDVLKLAHQKNLKADFLNKGVLAQVHVVAELGKLPELYALASVTLVAGSFIPDIGGHTPYEPVSGESAIITGPFTENFTAEYELLQKNSACLVTPPHGIAEAISQAFSNGEQMVSNAQKTIPSQNDVDQLFATIIDKMELDA